MAESNAAESNAAESSAAQPAVKNNNGADSITILEGLELSVSDTRGRGSRVFKRPTGLDGRADRSYRNPKSLHDLIKPTIGRFGWAEDFAVGSVMNNWEEIVGPTVAEKTRPVAFDKRKRELSIECDSTPWASNLRFMKPQILQAIERLAGEDIVRDLEIRGPDLGPKRKGRYKVQGRGPRDDYG